MQKEKIGVENGRSMVEMLAILALAGVFSIGGVVGYKYAMRLYQEAETLDQLSVLVAGGRSADIPLHYGFQTVGMSDAHVPYIVPIRDVVSRVRYRADETAFDVGLIDDEGKLIGTDLSKMREVREYESFDTLLDTPAWVRSEDENNWTVRITGLSYSLCEKLLRKSDLGFDYAYVALQNPDKTPTDPLMGDFTGVLKENKYANPDRGGEDGVATVEQIEKVCAMVDPTKRDISLAKTYIANLEKEGKTGIAPGADAFCSDKKSLACMAFGARLYNEETKQIDIPLQTLVLYFGQKSSTGDIPIEPFTTCIPGTPYTEESGGTVESQECCKALGSDKYFIPGIPKCCQLVENIENTPRCKVGPDGLYVINVDLKMDSSGNQAFDAAGNPLYEEKISFETSDITSEEEIYIGGDWTGEGPGSNACCPAKGPVYNPVKMCHKSSITGSILPWMLISSKKTTTSQYQNCPLGATSQTSELTSEACCIGSGEYWAEADGQIAGAERTSESGKALCCSQNSVFALRSVSTTDQCPWEAVSNVPTSGTAKTGAVPKDITGTPTTDCCYKTTGLRKRLKTSACAYEGGVLKYSKECCNVATDIHGQQLAYVEAPHYTVGGSVSQECGVVAGASTSVTEPDRNCCVDYKALETSFGNGKKLESKQPITDWSGMPSPEYCCQTLVGTALAPTEEAMKKNFEKCCEADFYFATTNAHIRKKATFVPSGTEIQGYNKLDICPVGADLTGLTCYPRGRYYKTTENNCCDLSTGKASNGTENKVCCDYASAVDPSKFKKYWDGTACVACSSCEEIRTDPPDPDPEECLEDPNHCFYVWEETIDPEPYTITNEETICKAPMCVEQDNTCCQDPLNGHQWDGSWSPTCCGNICGTGLNKTCFMSKSFQTAPSVNCLEVIKTEIPVDPPPYKKSHRKCVHPCPNGYPPLSEIPKI